MTNSRVCSPYQHDNERAKVTTGLLALMAAVWIAPMGVYAEYMWVPWVLSGAILGILLWVNFGSPILRRHRLKSPCDVWFNKVDGPLEISVPANSTVTLDFRIKPVVKYECRKLIFGFVGDEKKVPIPQSVFNEFVKVGRQREMSPGDNETHFIDAAHLYHYSIDRMHMPPDVYAHGYRVQTRAPGKYEIYFVVLTDEGEGIPKEGLALIVE